MQEEVLGIILQWLYLTENSVLQ